MYTAAMCLSLDGALHLFEDSGSDDDSDEFLFLFFFLVIAMNRRCLIKFCDFHVKYGDATYTRINTVSLHSYFLVLVGTTDAHIVCSSVFTWPFSN